MGPFANLICTLVLTANPIYRRDVRMYAFLCVFVSLCDCLCDVCTVFRIQPGCNFPSLKIYTTLRIVIRRNVCNIRQTTFPY